MAQPFCPPAIIDRATKIKLAIFDVDGILTDGKLYYSDTGEQIKAFHSLDGQGLKMLKATGIKLVMISGTHSKGVALRAEQLGFDRCFQGIEHKQKIFDQLLEELGYIASDISYMGDDVIDLPVMRRVGLAVTVPTASDIIHRYAHYVTRAMGGQGAVREFCELVMQAQGTFETQLAHYVI